MRKHVVPETAAPPFRRLLLVGFLGLALIGVLVVQHSRRAAGDPAGNVLAADADSAEIFWPVAPFQLVERSGAPVTLDTLKGRPWIAGFVFTRCTGPCPRITANMRKLQGELADSDVRLVSFSVDPLHDTPQILEAYADTFGADPERWLFLTGPLEEVRRVSFESFRLPFERDDAQPAGQLVAHRTVLTVVDREGQIRGYYDGETDAGVQQAQARARFLASRP